MIPDCILDVNYMTDTIAVFNVRGEMLCGGENVLVPKRYTLKTVGVKCHDVCNSLSDGSGGKASIFCVLERGKQE